jgi:hypothetical protein
VGSWMLLVVVPFFLKKYNGSMIPNVFLELFSSEED